MLNAKAKAESEKVACSSGAPGERPLHLQHFAMETTKPELRFLHLSSSP